MGKHIIVLAFASAFIGAVVVFFQRGERQAKKPVAVESNEKHSRVTIEEFVLYEYRDHHATGTFQGKLAQFEDPDTLEIFGNIRGNRINEGKKEFVAAESAALRFSSKGLTDLVKDSKLETVTMENQVQFGTGDITMFTDYAKFDNASGKLVSDRPVRMKNPQADMLGKKGFEYDSKTQDVKVFGPLEGTLVDAEQ
ncbi:MAG: hypothetical protein EOP10_25590 [Proteobacteria bacterium]|nr:MAG: hypothetical protein EOP10_25590 [Pseudomonadota bacterium]